MLQVPHFEIASGWSSSSENNVWIGLWTRVWCAWEIRCSGLLGWKVANARKCLGEVMKHIAQLNVQWLLQELICQEDTSADSALIIFCEWLEVKNRTSQNLFVILIQSISKLCLLLIAPTATKPYETYGSLPGSIAPARRMGAHPWGSKAIHEQRQGALSCGAVDIRNCRCCSVLACWSMLKLSVRNARIKVGNHICPLCMKQCETHFF